MLVLRLALRNLFRQVRRNVLTATVVVAGVFAMIAGGAFITGMRENVVRAQEDTLTGHALVRPAGYPTAGMFHPVDALIEVSEETRALLDARTEAWTVRTMFIATAVRGPDSVRVRGVGFDPARDAAVFPRQAWRVVGEIPVAASDGVLVSRGVARLLELNAGDRMVLKTRTAAGALNALDVPVAGVFTAGNPALDLSAVFVPEVLAQDLVRMGERSSHVALRLGHRDEADRFAPALRATVGDGAEVVTWRDESADLLALMDIRQRALDMLSTIILLLAALGIMNTTLMAAYERVREVGTLRAMGMTRREVVALFVVEGAMVGTVGSVIGGALGGWLAWHFSTHGIDLSATLDNAAYGSVPISTMLYTDWDPMLIVRGMAVGVVMAALAAIYPAWVASNMAPAEAVRAS